MKFRRKSADEKAQEALDVETATAHDQEPQEPLVGPFDAEDLPDDGLQRVDLGSLLIAPPDDRELRMQVDETTGEVQSVMLAGADGALELRAFAAPRHGDLWSEVRPKIAADMAQRGGTATEREGRFGAELVCAIQVQRPEGNGVQNSRIIGINGSRWLLRATFLGTPARDLDASGDWEDLLTQVAVRRGGNPMMVGEPLPLVLPESARRVQG
ncbi:DUF3710 domain-containing protein [Nocardioides rubriscoriae]|uniref:DUF3710 domain-containing protein n=1 Tax=Nocardioides rubriscoriae TaxID=642762 RepID=UPI001FEC6EE5|nr:DUF3710 domain-containing protein [Nocardioides rubriscoriae]